MLQKAEDTANKCVKALTRIENNLKVGSNVGIELKLVNCIRCPKSLKFMPASSFPSVTSGYH